MRLALVANPGSGAQLEPSDLAGRLRRLGAEVVLCEGGWRGDEATRARAAGADRVVAAGGDGIVAPCAALAGDLGVPLAVVPTGTANDFARAHDLPGDLDAACELAVRGKRLVGLELAYMDDRPFVNAASAGLSPQAASAAKPLKKALGALAYPLGALAAGLRGRPVEVTAQVDGREVHSGRAWQVIVAATGAFGGGAEIDAADPRDGRLDLVVVPAGPRLGLVRRAAAMRRGDLAGQDGVIHARGAAVELDVPAKTAFNVDGELLESGVSRFRATGGAWKLVAG